MNCPACSRRTPSARASCLYCGAALPVTRIEVAPPQRAIDSIEHAFNTILQPPRRQPDEQTEAALAAALNIEATEARALVGAGQWLPVARSQSPQEAELIAALVRTCGLGAIVVGDEELQLETEIVRARRIVRGQGELEVHHSGGVMTAPLSDVKLMVVGALRNTRVDYTEGISGVRSAGGTVFDSAEFRGEETLLDVYSTSLNHSFRMKADAFDYSGLVWPLSFRAELNFQTAISALHGAAPRAVVDDSFARIRGLLARAWPERTRTEARGVKRTGLAYRPVARSSVISDNRDQFERYSRLMFLSSVSSNQ